MTALLIVPYYREHFLSMLVAVDTCRNLLPRRLAAGLTQNRRGMQHILCAISRQLSRCPTEPLASVSKEGVGQCELASTPPIHQLGRPVLSKGPRFASSSDVWSRSPRV